MNTNPDLTNREVVEELESWRLRNLLTPANLVAMVVFVATATTVYVRLTDRVIAAEADITAESKARDKQVKELEQRIDKRLDKLESAINARFREQRSDLQTIQQLLYRMLEQRAGEREKR